MSVFHQIKNIFSTSNTKLDSKQTAEEIVREENIKKSKLPIYKGLEEFELVKKLGEGAFSNVYEAINKSSNQHVAIKIIRKYELSQIQRASILKEIQIMRTVNHPSIIKMHTFIETQEYYFLVLELMNGGEIFHQIVHLTYFSEDLARHCIRQVAEGIRYLHEERGIVHRDIKPENILFERIPFMERKTSPLPTQPENEDEPKEDEGEFVPGLGAGCIGRVKIADFGLSKVVWDKHTMTPCGTVGYTAPEIVRDERYSKSVDMWALGCVLYTMLCGFPPFYDESIATLTKKVAKGQYTFLSPWWDHISVEAKHLVHHLLEINPKKRYTINQFLAHPWMMKQDTPVQIEAQEHNSTLSQRNSPDLIAPPSTTTSVAEETVSVTHSSPKNIPRSKRKDLFLSGIASMKEALDVSYAVHRMGEERAQRKEKKNSNKIFGFNRPIEVDEEEEETVISSGDDDEEVEAITKDTNNKLHINNTNLISKLAAGSHPPTVNKRVKPGFQLNMNNATLLGRRKKDVSLV